MKPPSRPRTALIEPWHTDFERNCLLKWSFRFRDEAENFCGFMERVHGVFVEPYRCKHCRCWHTTKRREPDRYSPACPSSFDGAQDDTERRAGFDRRAA